MLINMVNVPAVRPLLVKNLSIKSILASTIHILKNPYYNVVFFDYSVRILDTTMVSGGVMELEKRFVKQVDLLYQRAERGIRREGGGKSDGLRGRGGPGGEPVPEARMAPAYPIYQENVRPIPAKASQFIRTRLGKLVPFHGGN
jgi:hypothetical protein